MLKDEKYIDSWGCTWTSTKDGTLGTVTSHPLDDWAKFKSFIPPNPENSDGVCAHNWKWDEILKGTQDAHKSGEIVAGYLEHGHTWLRLEYLRGFENLCYDMADEDENLKKLIEIVSDFSVARVKHYIDCGVDMIYVPEDLGTQTSLLLSPQMFRKYIKPAYAKITRPIVENNILLHMHSDGYIMDVVDDLIECGMNALNLQDLVNGIDNIQKHLKGRVAIDLDIDRQNVTVNGSPKDCKDLISEAVEKLNSPSGGLSLYYQLWETVPIENVEAIMNSMEELA
jgi:uroporphyrinogen decarboxylase